MPSQALLLVTIAEGSLHQSSHHKHSSMVKAKELRLEGFWILEKELCSPNCQAWHIAWGGHFVITSQLGTSFTLKDRDSAPDTELTQMENTKPFSSLKNIKTSPPVIKSDSLSFKGQRMHQISSIFFRKLFFFCNYMTVSFYKTWLKVVLSVASGCAQRVIIVDVTGFHKPALHPPSDIGPCLARGIPHLFFEPNEMMRKDVQSTLEKTCFEILK